MVMLSVHGDSYGGAVCSKATFMVVLYVLRRQLWWCYLFRATVMVLFSLLSRQLWWCYLF